MLKALKIFFYLNIFGVVIVTIATLIVYEQVKDRIPTVAELKHIELQIPLRIYTADHKLIGEFGEQQRIPITYAQIPTDLEHAILSAEDSNFYHHPGVDIMGLGRALMQLITTGQIQSGGSTITMQVARNYFLSLKQTFTRKFTEIFISLKMEKELTKHDILELYINKIYLGNHSYGFEAASQVYYNKPLKNLDIAQYAMLAGLSKAPSIYNPVTNPSRALIRRNWILKRMLSLGYIDKNQYQTAVETSVIASNHGITPDVQAGYVAEMVRSDLFDTYKSNLYTIGLNVYTTINSKLQQNANQAVNDGVLLYNERHGYRGPLDFKPKLLTESLENQKKVLNSYNTLKNWQTALELSTAYQTADLLLSDGTQFTLPWDAMSWAKAYINVNTQGPSPTKTSDIMKPGDIISLKPDDKLVWKLTQMPKMQSALVTLRSKDGAIQALVGGFNYNESKFNRVTQSKRQTGSSFKPFIYSSALAHGYTAASTINDAPVVFNDTELAKAWRPTNNDGKFYGPTRLRPALYRSQNIVSIRLLNDLGIQPTLDFIRRFGFNSDELPHNLSLSLGTASLSPLQMATGYTVFSNGGYQVKPYLIDHITNRNNRVIFQAKPATVCNDCTLLDNSSPNDQKMGLFNTSDGVRSLPVAKEVLDPSIDYIMYDIMRDVIKHGTGRRAQVLDRSDLAGKTGTTNNEKDAWFSGFNGKIVTTVWSGFDEASSLGQYEWGGSVSLPTWIDFMRPVLKGTPMAYIYKPSSMITVRINPKTGERALPGQKNAIFEIFRKDHVPLLHNQNNLGSNNSQNSNVQKKKQTNKALENLF